MQVITSTLLLFVCTATISLAQIAGKKVSGPITVSGVTFKEGDTLSFGSGTMPNGDFKYIVQPPNVFAGSPEYHMNRSYSGRFTTIKSLKNQSSKRFGDKFIAVISTSGFNCAVELEDAMRTNEIVAVNGKAIGSSTATAVKAIVSSGSVADELLKLKQLLDAGAITQAEYDAQKKKLLEK